MTDEEIKAAEDAKKGDDNASTSVVEIDAIAKLEEEKAKLIEERDNYKNVALKRLGKLPGDAEFLSGEGKSELTVEEQVKLALLQREIDANEKAKAEETKRLAREVSELRLALKNRPQDSIGDGGGATVEVKDNVLSNVQIEQLKARALSLKVDPEKFIENFKKNLRSHQ